MYGVFLAIGDRRERARARAVVERERGFRLVGEAGDGATAFAMIRDIQPDVVIAELRMPFVDGAALCRGLRRSFPWMESLIVGARNDALFAGALNEAELERSLSTPITALALSEALHRAAERADAERRAIPGRVRRAAAEQDPSEHPGRGGLPPWPEDGRPRRVVWIPAPDAERRRDAFGALLRIEQMRVAEDGMFTFRLEDGAGMVMVRGEGTELEALAYGAANIARFSLGDVMGFRPQIYVSSEETDAVGMRRALEELRARGASPEPGWLILGMDDRPRPLRGMRFPISPLGEALLTARRKAFWPGPRVWAWAARARRPGPRPTWPSRPARRILSGCPSGTRRDSGGSCLRRWRCATHCSPGFRTICWHAFAPSPRSASAARASP